MRIKLLLIIFSLLAFSLKSQTEWSLDLVDRNFTALLGYEFSNDFVYTDILLHLVNGQKISIKLTDGDSIKSSGNDDFVLIVGKNLIKKSYGAKSNRWAYIIADKYKETCDYCIHFAWEDNDFWIEPNGRVFLNKKHIQTDMNTYLSFIEFLAILNENKY